MEYPEVCIAGAGIIGLSLALELHRCGVSVQVLEQGEPLAAASTAAAGMLAANDPDNPPQLRALSQLSASLYPEWLDRLHALSGERVVFQTARTLQRVEPDPPDAAHPLPVLAEQDLPAALQGTGMCYAQLQEHSLDPRLLASALLAAVRAAGITVHRGTTLHAATAAGGAVHLATSAGGMQAQHFVDCCGAWSTTLAGAVVPRKGQMLTITLPPDALQETVVRSSRVYVVPRTSGPAAGQAILGATVEDVGFDVNVHAQDLQQLQEAAAAMMPALRGAPMVTAWAGIRPATRDRLPVLGQHPQQPHVWLATGHYRNGILLAPATAQVIARQILRQPVAVDLTPFAPQRLMP
ncbi:MAG: FAD-dependent oxidoreductase [Acidobacteriota bacterium]|nr:FAD-dependent oxidoreductase [Acidobacteriota bacterium]